METLVVSCMFVQSAMVEGKSYNEKGDLLAEAIFYWLQTFYYGNCINRV